MQHPDDFHTHDFVVAGDAYHQVGIFAVSDARIASAGLRHRLLPEQHHADLRIAQMELVGDETAGQGGHREAKRKRLKILSRALGNTIGKGCPGVALQCGEVGFHISR
jgi:hypothetical protein